MKKWRRRKTVKQIKSKDRLTLDFIVTKQEDQMTLLVKQFCSQEKENQYSIRKKLISNLATKILGRARKVKERLQQIDFEFNNF